MRRPVLTRRRRIAIAGAALAAACLSGCGAGPEDPPSPLAAERGDLPPAPATAATDPAPRAGTAPTPETVPESALRLRPAAPVERCIEGGGRHLYRLALDAGDFLHLEVDQRGVDVVARLAAPDGTALLEVDSPSDDLGPEVVRAVAARSGEYRLEVGAFPARGGLYVVTVAALRPATDDDRARAAAAAGFAAAEALAAADDATAARAAYRRAGEAWRRLGDHAGHAHTEDRLGRLADRRRDPAAAAAHHRRAAALFAAAGEQRWRGISLTLLGTALFEQGELWPAGGFWEEALALRRAAGDTAGEATLLHNLGHLAALLGEPARALESYERSLERRRTRGEEAAKTLHNLGVLLLILGRTEEALDRLHDAEATARRTGDDHARTGTLLHIGHAESALGRAGEASESFERALGLARRTGDRRLAGQALSHLGLLAYRGRDLPEARRRQQDALGVFRELEDLPAAGAALTNLGAVELAAGNPAAARERFLAAAPLLRNDADPWHRAENLHGRARAEELLGRLEAAQEAAEAAVELVDSPRLRLGSVPLTASYSATIQPYFDRWVEVLMALHRRRPDAGWDRRALAAAERGRARSFLDAAALARAGPPPAGGDLAAEAAVRRRLAALEAERLEPRRNGASAAVVAALERELRDALVDLERLARRRRALDPRRAGLAALEPLTPERIRRALPADAALVEIELTAENGYLWVVTADGVESHELGARQELEAAARSAYELLRRSHRREAVASARRALCRLSRVLLAPAAGALARRRLLVVAEGALLYLPFAALPHPAAPADGGGCSEVPLAATHAVVQLPSASLLAALAGDDGGEDRNWRGEIAVVGDPAYSSGGPYRPLPFSREEAEAVLAAAPQGGRLALLGADAGLDTVLSGRLEGFRRLHFAAHGVADPHHPELSGLVLSTVDTAGRPRNGFLSAHEIAALDLDAELVTLSACRTALGAEIPGEGLVGLTRSFFEAGARAVLVSLWSVDDRSTAELMRRFYAELFTGRPPADALARAQAAMAAEPAWEAPYHWAGFVLQGPFDL